MCSDGFLRIKPEASHNIASFLRIILGLPQELQQIISNRRFRTVKDLCGSIDNETLIRFFAQSQEE